MRAPIQIILLLAVMAPAMAQLRLPTLPLPLPLPNVAAPTLSVPATVQSLDRLSDVRRIAMNRLLRDNRRLIEADPNGDPVVRGEILAQFSTDAALQSARDAGYGVERQLESVAELHFLVLQSPTGVSTRRALEALRELDPGGTYDYNHLYGAVGALAHRALADSALPDSAPADRAPLSPSAAPLRTGTRLRVGLLDTGVDTSHSIFRDDTIHLWGCADRSVPAAHGTAVASLLHAAPGTELYAANVYCGVPTGGAVDAIVAALAWMVGERVAVINVSLVGPKNFLLERAVAALIERGHLIVAAVGNDGPTAPPLYPAAYPHVVGVTGVDASHQVLLEAERGPQVMFAALGADIKAAAPRDSVTTVRGTSFAAPTVARLLAHFLTIPDKFAADAAVLALAAQALDLGAPGRDLTYGYGFVEK